MKIFTSKITNNYLKNNISDCQFEYIIIESSNLQRFIDENYKIIQLKI